MNIRFNLAALAAVAVAMASKDVRYYLNAVCVETLADGGGLALVATNGHGLVVARDPEGAWDGREDDGPAQLLVPRDFVLAVLKACKGADAVEVRLIRHDEGPGYRLECDTGAQLLRADSIDGRFPEWRAVMPLIGADAPATVGAFDPAVLALAVDAGAAVAKRCGKKCGAVQLVGAGVERAVGFTLACPGFTAGGVVMPLRDTAPDRGALAALVAP